MTRVSDPRHPLWLQCNRCAPVAFTTRPVRKNQDISSTATLDRDTGQYGLRLHALKLTESYCTCARISRVGSGGCRRCCLPTCPCSLGWGGGRRLSIGPSTTLSLIVIVRVTPLWETLYGEGRVVAVAMACARACCFVLLLLAYLALPSCSRPSLSHLLSLLRIAFARCLPSAHFLDRPLAVFFWLSYCTMRVI